MITQKTINDVMTTARIEDVVSDFVNLRRRGVNLIGNCPFHDEKTPSFNVSPTRNIYKCFGCGKGGDSVRFIIEHEKMSFPDAIRFLAEKYNIVIKETENTAEQKEQKLVTDSLYIVNDFARDHFVNTLFERTEGRQIGMSYFKERGFLDGTIKKFQLGYATDERDDFTRKAIDKKYNIDILHALGLVSKNDIDFFRSRVMFTIHNVSGKVVAFAGRTLSADKKIPKYVNSPESEIYNKRAVLYGLYFAKEAIRKNEECIIVEGYTDVITLHQGGIENVVAASGTSLTVEQIKLIKRFTPNIKIIFDGDPAGIKAALRGLDLVLEADMNVKLVLLPENEDPDSFLAKRGPQGFQEYLSENEEDFLFFKTKLLLNEVGNDPIKKTLAIKDIVGSIAKIPDTFKRTLYIRQCSGMLELAENILIDEVNKLIKADQKNKRLHLSDNNYDPDRDSEEWLKSSIRLSSNEQPVYIINDAYQERAVCDILINFGEKIYDETQNITVAAYILENVTELLDGFDIPLYAKIIRDSIEAIAAEKPLNHQYFTSHIDVEIQNFAIDVLTSPYVYANWARKEITLQTQKFPEENYVRDSTNAMQRLQFCKSRMTIKSLKEKLDSATKEYKESDEYLIDIKVLQVLIQQRNELAGILGTVVTL
jgi:DNA primase